MKELAMLVPVVIALTEFLRRRTKLSGGPLLVISWIVAIGTSVVSQHFQGGDLIRGILPGVLVGLVANGSADFLKRLKQGR